MRKQGATWKQVDDIYETDGENVRAFAKKHEDLVGLVHYELPTVGEGDKYEQDNLYLGNQKGIHLYEFSTDKLNAIYYL